MPRVSTAAIDRVRGWAATLVILALSPCLAAAQDPPVPNSAQSLDLLIRAYRTEPIDAVLDRLAVFVSSKQVDASVDKWLASRKGDKDGERRELEAALMLYAEAIMRVWVGNDVYPDGIASRYVPALKRIHARLEALDGRSAFLHGWYLMWEAFRHAYVHLPVPSPLDFLDEALKAFPDDPEMLLAAGSRSELAWWTADANRHRNVEKAAMNTDAMLVKARDYFRRGVAGDPAGFELRLRLVRVLLALGGLDDAAKVAAGPQWSPTDPALVYLARLFEGELRERQGDYEAAARAYDEAIAKASQAQSARIARAHLEHAMGSRAQAAAMAIGAMSAASTDNDPWWLYNRGLVWHFDEYLTRLRDLVRR